GFHGRTERGRDTAEGVEVALAVRPAGADAVLVRDRDEVRLHLARLAAFLGETRGNDQGVFDTGLGAFLDGGGDRGGGDRDQREIDRPADGADGGEARQPGDVLVTRVDRQNAAWEAVLAQLMQQAAADPVQVWRGTEHRDGLRPEETMEGMLCHANGPSR